MKYISIILSLLLVLSFIGCSKEKETTDMQDTATEAVEEAGQVTGEVMEGMEEAAEEAKEVVKEVSDH
jgi:hypothetical protein